MLRPVRATPCLKWCINQCSRVRISRFCFEIRKKHDFLRFLGCCINTFSRTLFINTLRPFHLRCKCAKVSDSTVRSNNRHPDHVLASIQVWYRGVDRSVYFRLNLLTCSLIMRRKSANSGMLRDNLPHPQLRSA